MIKTKRKRRTSDGVAILERIIGNDSKMRQMIAREHFKAQVAQLIYVSRQQAGLTQAELAKMIGTKQPVIARLEDADYQGHSLTMLQKIAAALNQRLEIRFAAN